MNAFRVSQSKVKTWRRCFQAYHNKYVEKLKRKRVARPFVFGRIVHQMVESHANTDDPFDVLNKIAEEQGAMFRSQREELGDVVSDVTHIMSDYFKYWDEKGPKLNYVRMKGKASEHTFEVELTKGIFVEGKFDNFAKTPNKLLWLVEHKSTKNIPNDDHRWRDLQSSVYIRVAEMLELPPLDGTCWDYIRSKPPTAPQVLKNGEMSKRGIDTLPSKVLSSLFEAKLDVKNFKPLMASALANRSSYYQRVFTPVKARVVDTLFKDFVETAEQMAEGHGKMKSKNIDRHCDWCEFEPLCRAELQGLDVEFVKKKEYEKRGKRPEIEYDFEG